MKLLVVKNETKEMFKSGQVVLADDVNDDPSKISKCACGGSVAYRLHMLDERKCQIFLKSKCKGCLQFEKYTAEATAAAEEDLRFVRQELERRAKAKPLETGYLSSRQYTRTRFGKEYLYLPDHISAGIPFCSVCDSRPCRYDVWRTERNAVWLKIESTCIPCTDAVESGFELNRKATTPGVSEVGAPTSGELES
jgi:hypothetical protein